MYEIVARAIQAGVIAIGTALILITIGVIIGRYSGHEKISRKQAEFYMWDSRDRINERHVVVASKSPRDREIERKAY